MFATNATAADDPAAHDPRAVVGRALILLNPHGVSVRRGNIWPMARRLAEAGKVELVETTHAGHAREYCRKHAAAFDKIIIVGGDGTMMDAVNGIVGHARPAVAPLPGGSASDFARALPGYPTTLAALLAAERTRQVDLGQVTFADGTGQFFTCEAGIGIDADAVRYVPAWLRRISPPRAYDVGGFRSVLWHQAIAATVWLDDEQITTRGLDLLAVCNNRYFGGGMPIAPDARSDDGLLHVFLLAEATRWEIITSFHLLRQSRHVQHPRAVYRAARRVRLELQPGQTAAMCFDGDYVARTPARWNVLPGALKLIEPAANQERNEATMRAAPIEPFHGQS